MTTTNRPMALALALALVLIHAANADLAPDAQRALRQSAGAVPMEVVTGTDMPLAVLTSMFLHDGMAHLLGNVCLLVIFGLALEGKLGSARLLLVFIAAGMIGALAQCIATPESQIPIVGASGAVAGLMGAHLMVVRKFGSTLLLVGWFLSQLLVDDPGIAVHAHIGGFISGMVTTPLPAADGRGGGLRSAIWS